MNESNFRLGTVIGIFSVALMLFMLMVVLGTRGTSNTADEVIYSNGESILPELTPVLDLATAPEDEIHVAYAPNVPPAITRSDQRFYEVRLEVLENVCDVDSANGVKIDMWGYRVEGDDGIICGTPGPILRGRVGDVVRLTLTNLEGNKHPHNIDFHAVTGQGGGAKDLSVAPGETASIDVRLLYPGAFMYHCAFGDVPIHIAHGMYGMFIVDPEVPLPAVDHEWAVVQSEWYLTDPDEHGISDIDREALTNEDPDYVVFNGTVGALAGDNALTMKVGERARIYFVNEGLNLDSNFHPIGSQWDLVYPEGATHPANRVIRGSQSTLVVAGGGTVVELEGYVPSTIILVDHALVRTFYKGAVGLIHVEGEENHEIFEVSMPAAGGSDDHHHDDGDADHNNGDANGHDDDRSLGTVHEVSMVTGSGTYQAMGTEAEFADGEDPADYNVNVLHVKAGDTVRFTNDDAGMVHTATAVDGSFDTGFLATGKSYEVTFDTAGEYEYYCIPHPWMRAKIVVEE